MPLKGGRGSASMVQRCKLCSRENSIGTHTHTMTLFFLIFFKLNYTKQLEQHYYLN